MIRFPLALLLAACTAPKGDDTPVDPDDTDVDTADTADSGDTDSGDTDSGDTDSGDTAAPDPGAHAWGASFDAADLTIEACGSNDNGTHALAPGPDLDGDGLGELAIGAPGNDTRGTNDGAVYVLAGSMVADGARSWDAITIVVPAESTEGFGTSVTWVGDRDGDGLDDLVVGSNSGGLWTVSGADLLAGGEVTPRARIEAENVRFARWADVDLDGVDDWLFGFPEEGPDGDSSGEGVIAVVRDADFTLDGITRSEVAYGTDLRSGAGDTLTVLHEDWDGDGLPEFATILYDDLHVIGSAAFLAGTERLVDAALTDATWLSGHQVLAPGDIDGDGLDELVVFDDNNKVCVINGTDADGDEKICIRDVGLGPSAAALGDDLDGDGVPELWFRRDGWLVAQDLGALSQGIELELARVATPDTPYRLATHEGLVWVSAYLIDGVEEDLGWAYTQSFTPQRTLTLRGGKYGGSPRFVEWRDVTGDGAVDLLLDDESGGSLALFDGATLAAGGTYQWCDATASRAWSTVGWYWLDDVDGDGAADVFWVDQQEDDSYLVQLWSGRVAVGLEDGETPIASWTTEANLARLEQCDVDGDGQDDFYARGTEYAILSGHPSPDGTLPRLGALPISDTLWCLPDVDGDGRDELYTEQWDVYHLYHASQLDPAVSTRAEDAWLTIGGEMEDPEPIHAPDGVGGRVGWWFRVDGGYQLCLLDLDGLSGDIDVADVPQTCLPDLYFRAGTTAWLDAAVGDATLDILIHGTSAARDESVRVVDGATLGASTILVAEATGQAGPGPDLLGVGAGAIWSVRNDPDGSGADILDVVYARASEE